MTDYYTGTCYIGVVGPPNIPTQSVISIFNIQRRPGDALPDLMSGTKGYEVRQAHVNKFIESKHDWLLLLDHDMLFPVDTLERLRSYGKPYMSGHYLRRGYQPMYSVWYENFETGDEWPMKNYLKDPPKDRIVKIGASGWGCILIHREVIETTRAKILKGEPDIIEDDMDVWPYDLAAVMSGEERIRPLRCIKDSIVGSDIRYPFYAKAAGYQLWGDGGVECSHWVDYPLHPSDFNGQSPEYIASMEATRAKAAEEHRQKVRDEWQRIMGGQG